MENLEDLGIKTDDMPFKPITGIIIIMKNDSELRFSTPLSIEDFVKVWKIRRREVKIITGKESFVNVVKRHVLLYQIYSL